MNVSFKILGYEIASIEFDFGEDDERELTPLDKGRKALSRWWVRGMVK
ncbi:hypothetical protein [Mycobacterium phage SWU1]|uniref:Gene 60 protein n=2 Tax=Fromanvirus TaxID=186764 RepID=VG60_BPML5|nr:Hypothetical Protein PBI_L5_60 [Fromanvirus L5]YP_006382983.1 hypothetical protein A321_gp33 [Mycobacterium phage SWU1]Q05273.1 RecName: Full=Gene 60 protein; AltName: Full=Gp60 [Fromanvirus L5]AFI24973.1 hypothetical protein [Mycobacterium phage SWU1]CAA79436.1 Hypothetical Protein PBI_L5_60 [Fromanvirus L5]